MGGGYTAPRREKSLDLAAGILHAATACVAHDLHDVELVLRTHVTGTELFSTAIR